MTGSYLLVKYLHMACAVVSIGGFALRGLLMLRGSPLLQQAWIRRAPHVVDTVLLASAVYLAIVSRQYPVQADWLTAKLLALFLYIALGMLALRFGRSRRQRGAAFFGALLTATYIVLVARLRDPLPFF